MIKMEKQNNTWAQSWQKRLPVLALIGPACFFLASLVRAMGIGTLSGGLSWVSAPEGVILCIGVPFFVATFIFLGLRIAEQSPKTGNVVLVLGILGVAFLAFVSSFRALSKGLVDAGLDPTELNTAFESEATAIWLAPLFLFNLGQFIAWIIAGVAVIRKKLAPWWVGLALILAVPCIITAQAFYFMLELFWPLGNALWLLGVWGVVKSYTNDT